MTFSFKKLLSVTSFNSCLFLMLIIGLQNSSNKSKIDFLITKTVNLPIGFIIGTSFISGSLIGNLLSFNLIKNNNN